MDMLDALLEYRERISFFFTQYATIEAERGLGGKPIANCLPLASFDMQSYRKLQFIRAIQYIYRGVDLGRMAACYKDENLVKVGYTIVAESVLIIAGIDDYLNLCTTPSEDIGNGELSLPLAVLLDKYNKGANNELDESDKQEREKR